MTNFGSGGDDYRLGKPPPSWLTETRRRIDYEWEEAADRQRKAREAEEKELNQRRQQAQREAERRQQAQRETERAGQSPQEHYVRNLLVRPSQQLPTAQPLAEARIAGELERVKRKLRIPKLFWISSLSLVLLAWGYYQYPDLPFEPQEVRGLRLGASTLADVDAVLAARGEVVVDRRMGSLIAIETHPQGVRSVTYAVDPEGDRLVSIVIRTLHRPPADSALRSMTWSHLFGSRIVHWSDNTRVFWKPGLRIMISRDGAELVEMYSVRQ